MLSLLVFVRSRKYGFHCFPGRKLSVLPAMAVGSSDTCASIPISFRNFAVPSCTFSGCMCGAYPFT